MAEGIQIPSDIIKKIIEDRVAGELLVALGGATEIMKRTVDAVISEKVSESTGHTARYGEKECSWLEYKLKSAIRDAVHSAIYKATQEHRDALEASILAALQEPGSTAAKSLAGGLVKRLGESVEFSKITVSFGDKRET